MEDYETDHPDTGDIPPPMGLEEAMARLAAKKAAEDVEAVAAVAAVQVAEAHVAAEAHAAAEAYVAAEAHEVEKHEQPTAVHHSVS
mmetsp:Transcript_29204/g.36257  ORF Transcript_29204/g.36257 Transcript_29204/m.36257 type:complete len:86 (+) Transcript_29204:981-1238(+)